MVAAVEIILSYSPSPGSSSYSVAVQLHFNLALTTVSFGIYPKMFSQSLDEADDGRIS